ncbi:hypothetical protein C7H19_19965 [Aphanothece hegewaldii CCALA 016]|uniref:Uncharacterized protein n=1 Tax=Aphanothece hegewaldii CCALA 016 TaxID=2107694 RepID=A0A2T1LT21_9CHRO|nr:hypothetical protein [Aphanothece hegewaldii]PSF33448.1 hypothetical protein C7H19_19965 [Aphanothece hegewaldii CCALA 016]
MIVKEQASGMENVILRFYENLTQEMKQSWEMNWRKEEPVTETKNSTDEPNSQAEKIETESKIINETTVLDNLETSTTPAKKEAQKQDGNPEITTLVRIHQNSKIIYEGQIKNGKGLESEKDEQRLAAQLEILQSLSEGTVVPMAANMRVEIETQQAEQTLKRDIVFQTDDRGKITTNVANRRQSISGLEVVRQQLSSVENNQQLVAEVAFLRNRLEQMNERIQQQEQTIALIEQRKQEPNNPNAWQRLLRSFKASFQQWQQLREEQQAVSTVRDIFRREVYEGGQKYEGKSYTIVRVDQPLEEKEHFSVRDKQGQEVLNFEMSPSGTVQIQASRLNTEILKDLNQARQSIRQNQPIGGAFASLQTQTLNKHARTEQLIQRLVTATQGRTVEKEGEHYTLNINSRGETQITAKDGRGLIYARSKQQEDVLIVNRMTSSDLSFFEEQLKQATAMQPQESQQAVVPTGGRSRSR